MAMKTIKTRCGEVAIPDFSSTPENGYGEPKACEPGKVDLTETLQPLINDIDSGNVFYRGEKVLSLIHLSKLHYKHLKDQGE